MDAITLLTADHRKVAGLLREVQETEGDDAARAALFEKIRAELTAHSEAEETIFYPALKAKATAGTDAGDEVDEAYEEHANVKAMLEKIAALDPSDDTYSAKLQVLDELVKHHVNEEESTMFESARDLLTEPELAGLGAQLQAKKESLLAKTR